ncbi:MAG: LysR family transcriptional regulator [Rhodovibrionaceae bacterium]|nr:LysR family transcriptional regulator [Rhodovibrionaceae bacterium]
MHIEQIRTFLEVANTGNFHRAAQNLNVTQSTVSARIRQLEDSLGEPLFLRSHAGVQLSAAGQRFRRFALNMQRLWRRAEQEVALPRGYRGRIGLGSQVSLWDRLILRWIPWMRDSCPDVAIRVEADYSTSLMRQVADGVLDIAVLYQPRRTPGLVSEQLINETLVMVSTRQDVGAEDWRQDYVLVDWGRDFRITHGELFPDVGTPPVSVGLGALGLQYVLENGGSAYFPIRVVRPLLAQDRLTRVPQAPTMRRPAYIVYAEETGNRELVDTALEGLRQIAIQGESEDRPHAGD